MGLTGVKREEQCYLYLKNVMVDRDTDEEIGGNIKAFATSKGLRIMSHKVIRNRFVDDVVGCKITVPSSQEHLAITPGFWPTGIECRHWERMPPNWNKRSNNKYAGRSDNWDYRDQEGESYINRYD